MIEIIARLITRHRTTIDQLIKYIIVGFVAMAVDMGGLWLMMKIGFGPYVGRGISFMMAVTVSWWLNRSFTFRGIGSGASLWRQWLKFTTANTLGFAANYGTYAACVATIAFFKNTPELAVVPASVVGLLFNFTAAKKVVFR